MEWKRGGNQQIVTIAELLLSSTQQVIGRGLIIIIAHASEALFCELAIYINALNYNKILNRSNYP